MKASIITICETIYQAILSRVDASRGFFSEGALITFCGLLSVWHLVCHNDNRSDNYLLVLTVAFEISLQHVSSENLFGNVTVKITLCSLNPANYFFAKRNGQASFQRFKKYAVAVCGFLGNTLLGTLGAEIAGLRALFLPAITFLQLSVKNRIQKTGISGLIHKTIHN